MIDLAHYFDVLIRCIVLVGQIGFAVFILLLTVALTFVTPGKKKAVDYETLRRLHHEDPTDFVQKHHRPKVPPEGGVDDVHFDLHDRRN